MKQQIRKPENWQDFEELCKRLWGEIWNCSEIKKNGRSGQNQQGVDIYGIPINEMRYYGIQCKGKDEYTNATLTEKEITIEIEKAKTFKPQLKKFYITTTANKDERIEEFIRIKNIEHIENKLFEIHLFCWEDIAYLIDQNKKTHDWYLRKIDFNTNFKISVLFDNNEDIKIFEPILLKNHITYKFKPQDIALRRLIGKSPAEQRKTRIEIDTDVQPIRHFLNGTVLSKSSCVFSIRLKNIGNMQVENFKLYLTFNDDTYTSAIVSKSKRFLDNTEYNYNIKWIKGTNNLQFSNDSSILVQNDEILSDKICIRPNIERPFCVIIPWKLVAKDFTEHGFIKIIANTTIVVDYNSETYSDIFPDEVILQNYVEDYDIENI